MTTRHVEHEITVAVPARTVYSLIAEVGNWPRIFPPTLHVDQLERGPDHERIRIWATANGEAKTWTSLRTLAPAELRITFRQEVSTPPVAAMGGTWIIEPLTSTTARVRLLHDYRAIDDDPAGLAWIDKAVDSNSRSELAALRDNVELAHSAADLTFSFEDSVRISGSAKDAYDFVNEAGRWAERLPHVASVHFAEDTPGLQTLAMETRAKDGSTHTTKSYRVTFPHHRIAYKQVTLPPLMSLHTGCWTFTETDGAVTATSGHTVVLNPGNITRVLGPAAGIAEARTYVRSALSTNSRATLGYAKDYAENRG
ncbi:MULTISPECIES: aromatase/cyclase [Streptomyces]|uniref:SRPBCC family protein n=1 Tax=Streptomyces cheonanensis TaxID=312720 RepID=A0ABP5H1F0_9ACTN|nr:MULTISPECIES: aromatase/cyclase [Streptomyces]QKV71649.1 SRPBCC family protein [Streptomyces harbinensis]